MASASVVGLLALSLGLAGCSTEASGYSLDVTGEQAVTDIRLYGEEAKTAFAAILETSTLAATQSGCTEKMLIDKSSDYIVAYDPATDKTATFGGLSDTQTFSSGNSACANGYPSTLMTFGTYFAQKNDTFTIRTVDGFTYEYQVVDGLIVAVTVVSTESGPGAEGTYEYQVSDEARGLIDEAIADEAARAATPAQ